MGRLNRFIWFLIMIIIGAGAGLYYAWYVKPADFVDAALYNLRQDYKTDYVLMAAEIYDQDHDRYHAMLRLDQILAPDETTEAAVERTIRNAEGFGYNPIDLEKMHRLLEVVTGQRSTPTPQYDPTMEFSIKQTSTAVAISLNPGISDSGKAVSTAVPENTGTDASGAPQADSDPFGTGIQITTDPLAVPTLDLPTEPTITPNPVFIIPDNETDTDSFVTEYEEPVGFSGIPDSFFEGR